MSKKTFTPTPEQIEAVESNKRNILVSASAGSGKTTVMIERILRLLSEGVQLSSMICCTFTKASAADMREKLSTRLIAERSKLSSVSHVKHKKLMEKVPVRHSDSWAARALEQLPLADISTIDSFCAKLSRNFFFATDLDPGFEVLENTKGDAILDGIILELLEEQLNEGDSEFLMLYEALSSSRYHCKLGDIIGRMYRFATIQEDVEGWLDGCTEFADKHVEHVHYLTEKEAAFAADSRHTLVHVALIVSLVREVMRRYTLKKQAKNRLDFNDIQHAALNILSNPLALHTINQTYSYLFVDEYQDTNPLQNAIFSKLSAHRFYVGDVKQSIYRFRLSDPTIFTNLYDNYIEESKKAESENKVINLNQNFRSDGGILSFCDTVFSSIMTREMGGIDYDTSARFNSTKSDAFNPSISCNLVRLASKGAEERPMLPAVYSVKHHVFNKIEKPYMAQIHWIVQHVSSLLKQTITLPNGEQCAITAGDIAILLRSVGGASGFKDALLGAFAAAGLAAVCSTPIDFLENPIVRMLCNFLRLCDNRRDDIALASVLKSPLGGSLTDAELLHIKQTARTANTLIKYKNLALKSYTCAVEHYIKQGSDAHIAQKLKQLFADLDTFKTLSSVLSFQDLAGRVVAHFDLFRHAFSKGGDTPSNLSSFLDALSTLDPSLTLSETLSSIAAGSLKSNTPTASQHAVRIMSIHSSKGLEFPFVILANLEKEFNTDDLKKDCLLDAKFGAVLKYYDTAANEAHKTALWLRARNAMRHKGLEEEMRLMYVALTRGIYQTALFASVKEGYRPKEVGEATCQLDWLYSFLQENANVRNPKECIPTLQVQDINPIKAAVVHIHDDTLQAIKSFTEFTYPYAPEPVKLTATAIARENARSMSDTIRENSYSMSGIQATNTKGIEFGIVHHKFFEVYDFTLSFEKNWECFKQHHKAFAPLIKLDSVQKAAVILSKKIEEKKFYRELPFIHKSEKGALIQGVIDLVIIGTNGVEIIDYKTGKLVHDRLEEYKTQLDVYASAVTQILKLDVISKTILSLSDGTCIEV